jgi:hypothetical protein
LVECVSPKAVLLQHDWLRAYPKTRQPHRRWSKAMCCDLSVIISSRRQDAFRFGRGFRRLSEAARSRSQCWRSNFGSLHPAGARFCRPTGRRTRVGPGTASLTPCIDGLFATAIAVRPPKTIRRRRPKPTPPRQQDATGAVWTGGKGRRGLFHHQPLHSRADGNEIDTGRQAAHVERSGALRQQRGAEYAPHAIA